MTFQSQTIHESRATSLGLLTGSPIVGCYSQHFVPSGVFVRVNRAEYFTRLYTDFDVSLTVNVPAIYDPVDGSLIQAIDSELTPEEKASLGFGQANGPEAAQNILAWRLALQRANVFRSPGGPSEEATRHIREIATGYFKRSRPTHAILYAGLIGPLHAASEYLLKTFPSLLRYLGPLRDEPRPLQPWLQTGSPCRYTCSAHTLPIHSYLAHTLVRLILCPCTCSAIPRFLRTMQLKRNDRGASWLFPLRTLGAL